MRKNILLWLMLFLATSALMAQQRGVYGKMSSMVRRASVVASHEQGSSRMSPLKRQRSVCAFVKIDGDGRQLLQENGCQWLDRIGNIDIALIPVSRLSALSLHPRVMRIEAGESCRATLDTTCHVAHYDKIHAGQGLSQAFTGRGVVVGLQDIGFDLTHPTFRDTTLQQLRIKCFWDQLSKDSTAGAPMPVGRAYSSPEAILALGCSTDGHILTHGTHTLGIATGTGYDTPYRGVAFESDICLVANATLDNSSLIDSLDMEKFTTATDALGFKYLFDYAQSQGKPCVVSFSEGSYQDLYGDNKLFYEALDSLVGPGRIFVASAGNEGTRKGYIHKPVGCESMGSFFISSQKYIYTVLRSADPFAIRFSIYDEGGLLRDTVRIDTHQVIAAKDSDYIDTLQIFGEQYVFEVAAYPNCFNPDELAYDCVVLGPVTSLGIKHAVSIELVGREADVCLYRTSAGNLFTNKFDPTCNAGEFNHTLFSPGAAPCAICVGANTYRTTMVNDLGESFNFNRIGYGCVCDYSSVGPTFDERIKPDVCAPGNLISSFSSFYLENRGRSYLQAATSEFEGRVYPWTCDIGTSMSTPLVAGIIALWLQANPTLTPDEVKEVLSRTCTHYDPMLSYPNNYYGHGNIDAYAGLLDVLQFTKVVPTLSRRQPAALQFLLKPDRRLLLSLASSAAHPISLSFYALSGHRALSCHLPAGRDSYSQDLSSLPKGVYAVQATSADPSLTGSQLIRIE